MKRDWTKSLGVAVAERRQAYLPNFWDSLLIRRESEVNHLRHLTLHGAVSVVSVVGLMGVGKTALVQHIVAGRDHCWVQVGPNADNLIFRDFGERRGFCASLEEIMGTINKGLSRRDKFLVLDDCRDIALCQRLLSAIPDAADRGRIVAIVTTRSGSLASALEATGAYVYSLGELSPDVFYQTLAENVSGSGNFQNNPETESTLREIVERCRRYPLIESTVAALVRTVGADRVLAGLDDWSFDGITEYFKWYYDSLPTHLKFPFQTLFLQKACGLSLEALTCLWMALGFLDPYHCSATQARTHLLDIGRQYLREIAQHPVSSDVEYAPGGVVRDIHIAGPIYGLSKAIARNQWGVICDLSSQEISSSARYVVWVEDNLSTARVPPELLKASGARLFILHATGQVSTELVRGIISGFESLRVLGLGGCNIEKLPNSIGNLKHLTYLDLGRNARLKRLPHSISKLWFLQTLFLHGCAQLQEIPASIGRLKNLMYLTLTTLQKTLPEEIGQLTLLHTLGLAKCHKLVSLPRSIKSLKSLQTLAIVDCQELDLIADSSVEGLKGHDGINTLLLRDIPKFKGLPPNLGAFGVAMKHLVVQSCIQLTETEWINQLNSLRSLTIEDCPHLSDVAGGTPQCNSLLELVIRRCERLCHTKWITQFISLLSLIIQDCPLLVRLDAGFSDLKCLKRLEIRGCPELTKRCAREGDDWEHIQHVAEIVPDGES